MVANIGRDDVAMLALASSLRCASCASSYPARYVTDFRIDSGSNGLSPICSALSLASLARMLVCWTILAAPCYSQEGGSATRRVRSRLKRTGARDGQDKAVLEAGSNWRPRRARKRNRSTCGRPRPPRSLRQTQKTPSGEGCPSRRDNFCRLHTMQT